MSSKLKVRLNIYTGSTAHILQVVAGFVMLEKSGVIDLNINLTDVKTYPYPQIVEAEINGIKTIFDTEDHSRWGDALPFWNTQLERIGFVFKRSYSEPENQVLPEHIRSRINPLGFNYWIQTGNIWKFGTVKWLKQIIQNCSGIYRPSNFEKEADHKRSKDDLSILFFTRLWDENYITSVI